mgnify:CR=1 FL=1
MLNCILLLYDTHEKKQRRLTMQKFIILNQEDIAQLLTMQDVLAAVEKAYSCKFSKQAELFPLVCHSFEDGYEEFDIKSGSADDAGIRF